MTRVKAGLAAAAAMMVTIAAAPAMSQPAVQAPGALTLTPAERTALAPLKQAVDARNWAVAGSLLPAARAAARSADARYVVARLELDMAIAGADRAGQSRAINSVLEARKSSPEEQAELLRQQAGIAYDAGNLRAAEASLERAVQIAPNDAEALSMLGQLNRNRNNPTPALAYFQRAVRAAGQAGRSLPESRYKVALAMAEQAGQRGVALEIARQYISFYPTAANWRDVLTVFRTVGTVDPGQTLDAMRLMRAAGALGGERDYVALAQALDRAGHPAEAKAVIDEGVAKRMVIASDPAPKAILTSVTPRIARERSALAGQLTAARAPTATAAQARAVADTLLSHARYAEAAELYRLAQTRVGEDPDLVNTRLGIALAMAGQGAEAEAAFRAATSGRSDLSGLWQTWLTRRPT